MIEISHVANSTLSPAERQVAAMEIWQREKGSAAFVIIFAWFIRLYFVLLMYSYAFHLRKGSYRTLPLSRSASAVLPLSSTANVPYDNPLGFMDEDEEIEDFYRVPLGVPSPKATQYHHRRCAHKANSSISSFTDFVSAPGRSRKPSGHGRHNSQQNNHIRSVSRSAAVRREIDEDPLFDEEESTAYASTSSRSRLGTEAGSSTATSDEERTLYSDRNKLSD